ncbi:uncharacterized protein NPIL_508891 [Nephila pilipes]|uniref:Uncharacterized protein n=1 Tax=Nephila pilipes TaxID=299642 RepID=A0A8X6J9C2_NEPPI|nr:uncharacterized protein NPIL_508891 [Nephila pilipes]
MQIMLFTWNTLRFLSENYIDEIQKIIYTSKPTTVSMNLIIYYCDLLGIAFAFVSLIPCIVLSVFAVYYGLTCSFIRVLLRHLLDQVDGDCFPDDPENLFYAYENIARYVRNVDEQLSLPVFLAIFFTMTGLFWGGYRIAFYPNMTKEYLLSLIIPQVFYFSVHLLIMVSASITNELANKAKCIMLCLPYRHPTQDPKKKYKFEKDLNQESCLTLWKIYVMDRSLVITSIGTLLTYGILLGTLGKDT